ncbi:MAG: polyprenyl synthetase family protein, partial [Anaerolineae bacterium]|nr:polyprenyl synthetase family protein [Anaerolineae bacterium]
MQNISLTPAELQYFDEELTKRKTLVYDYLASPRFKDRLQPEDIYESSYLYLGRTGKALRPGYLMWCCGASGGAEREPLSVVPAAAVETYHTWGLVHDDIIDMDDLRRGGPTVHRLFEHKARQRYGYDAADAERYGLAVAILAGDSLMGWTVSLLAEMFSMPEIDPDIPRFL